MMCRAALRISFYRSTNIAVRSLLRMIKIQKHIISLGLCMNKDMVYKNSQRLHSYIILLLPLWRMKLPIWSLDSAIKMVLEQSKISVKQCDIFNCLLSIIKRLLLFWGIFLINWDKYMKKVARIWTKIIRKPSIIIMRLVIMAFQMHTLTLVICINMYYFW